MAFAKMYMRRAKNTMIIQYNEPIDSIKFYIINGLGITSHVPEQVKLNDIVTYASDKGINTGKIIFIDEDETACKEKYENILCQLKLHEKFKPCPEDTEIDEQLLKRHAQGKARFEARQKALRKAKIERKKYLKIIKEKTEKLKSFYVSFSKEHGKMGGIIRFGRKESTITYEKYKSVNWSTANSATRDLLTIMFGRETLAVSSLTGKPSPAFVNTKPAKEMLNPDIVSDIIDIITVRYNVTATEVKTSITIKCADEHKMYKNRLAKAEKQKAQMELELPTPDQSESE